jgi:hypothetical protein
MSTNASTKMITAVFSDRHQAIQAYDWLRGHGYTIDEISVLMSDKTAPLFHAIEGEDKVEQRAQPARGAQATGAIGATVGAGLTGGLAAGVGLAFMGISLIAGGPLGLALAASIPGAMVGGLTGYGFPESSAKEYEESLRHGGVAIGVAPKNADEYPLLHQKFEELHGKNVLRV